MALLLASAPSSATSCCSGWRLRSHNALAARRIRAIRLSYWRPSVVDGHALVQVPSALKEDVKRMVRGKSLHVFRDSQNLLLGGVVSNNARNASLQACSMGAIDHHQLGTDLVTARVANKAKHSSSSKQIAGVGALVASSARWGDSFILEDDVPDCWEDAFAVPGAPPHHPDSPVVAGGVSIISSTSPLRSSVVPLLVGSLEEGSREDRLLDKIESLVMRLLLKVEDVVASAVRADVPPAAHVPWAGAVMQADSDDLALVKGELVRVNKLCALLQDKVVSLVRQVAELPDSFEGLLLGVRQHHSGFEQLFLETKGQIAGLWDRLDTSSHLAGLPLDGCVSVGNVASGSVAFEPHWSDDLDGDVPGGLGHPPLDGRDSDVSDASESAAIEPHWSDDMDGCVPVVLPVCSLCQAVVSSRNGCFFCDFPNIPDDAASSGSGSSSAKCAALVASCAWSASDFVVSTSIAKQIPSSSKPFGYSKWDKLGDSSDDGTNDDFFVDAAHVLAASCGSSSGLALPLAERERRFSDALRSFSAAGDVSDRQFNALRDLLASFAGSVDDVLWDSFKAGAVQSVLDSGNQGSSSSNGTSSHLLENDTSSHQLDSDSSSHQFENVPPSLCAAQFDQC